jgi:mRNA (guanine-N7-)-methyltransferase
MIKRLQETTFDSRGDLDSLIAALHVDITIAVIDPMQRFSSNVKAIMKKSRVPFRVLDLACGRGGDLNKWTRDCEVKLYVGVDISVEELKEAKQRAETFKGSSAFHFFRSSCDSPTLLQDLKPIVGAGHKQDARAGGVAASMHVVWCQFALHYFCETRASLSAFLKNVSGALTRGGRFCASFPNPCAVIGHLNQTHLTGQCTSGNSICFVSAGAGVILPIAEDVGLREFGIAYNFTLGDAVQECAEYVVPLRVLVELAAEAGLKLKRLQQMHAFMAQCAEDEELVSLREVMQ